MKFIQKTTFLFLFVVMQSAVAQVKPFIGLWEVEKVSMGNRSMTPVAKWAKYESNGKYTSGNGWLKHIEGSWSYDESTKTIVSEDFLGVKDPLGGFKISFKDQKMVWKRNEEGNTVTVVLKPIIDIPASYADYLVGAWGLKDIKEKGGSIKKQFDPNQGHQLYFGWDRVVRIYDTNKNRTSGYWHINGHRPEITLIPHSNNKKRESWTIQVNEDSLIMTGKSSSNKTIVRYYKRIYKL